MVRVFLIFVGGGLGALARYGLSGWMQRWFEGPLPAGTFLSNAIGCLLIGFLATAMTGPVFVREEYRVALLVGLLGGFTTFSSYAWESFSLLADRQYWAGCANLLLHNAVGLSAVLMGSRLAGFLYGA